jgi:uncharacterized protein YnzC (UPF0291/DUF896 family)
MKTFKTHLEEAASGKNLHMTHAEDAVIDGGVTGTRNVINYFRAIRDMLSGNASAPVNISVKWDGAPAIFAGIDPSDGKFFIAKKGVFNKNPKIYKTNDEIDNDLSGELNAKFKVALAEFSKLGIKKGVIQGDFLFTQEDISTDTIDGESYITFHPNTIVYAIPASSDLAKRIKRSKIGVVWHTLYGGDSFETMSATFGKAITPNLKEVSSVWSVDATFEDKSGNATFTKEETAALTSILSQAGTLFRTIPKNALNDLADPELNMRVNTYINSLVRQGQRIKNVKTFVKGLIAFVNDYYDKQASKRSTPAGKKKQDDLRNQALTYFKKNNAREIEKVFTLYNHLVDAKLIIVRKLEKVGGLKTFLKTRNGYEITGQEGFVAIDHLGQNSLKLVDRLQFSNANFSDQYIKGWEKK